MYDSEDENVHKLLKGIFGTDQMLDVKNGKIAKIHSSLTPKQRDYFFGMVSEALNKMETEDNEENNEKNNEEKSDKVFEGDNKNDYAEEFDKKENKLDDDNLNFSKKELNVNSLKNEDIENKTQENNNSRKVSAEKLIQEFSNFLNNIS